MHQFRHLQLRRPVFVVGADRRAVKPGHHALFEESSRAKHLTHRRFRGFVGRRVGGAFRRASSYRWIILDGHVLTLGSPCRVPYVRPLRITRRIGYALGQKNRLCSSAEMKSPVTIAYPSLGLAASSRRHETMWRASLLPRHLALEHAADF